MLAWKVIICNQNSNGICGISRLVWRWNSRGTQKYGAVFCNFKQPLHMACFISPCSNYVNDSWNTFVPEKLTESSAGQNFDYFMESEGFLPCPQQPVMMHNLSQINLVHTFQMYVPKIRFNIIFPPMRSSSEWPLIPRLCNQYIAPISLIPHEFYMPHTSHSLISLS